MGANPSREGDAPEGPSEDDNAHTWWVTGLSPLSTDNGKDANYFATCSYDKTVRIFDKGGKCKLVLRGHASAVLCVCSLQGHRVAAGGLDGSVIVWNCQKPQTPERVWRAHEGGGVRALCVLADGRLASSGDDGIVCVWDLRSPGGQEPKSIELRDHAGKPVFGLGTVGKGRALLATASLDKTVRIFEPAKKGGGFTCVRVLSGHSDTVNAVTAFGETHVVSGSSDATLRLWSLQDGSCEKVLRGHKGAVLSVTPLEKTLVLTGSTDRTARIWDLSNGAQLGSLKGHSHWVNTVMVFGKTAVTVSNDKTIRMWQPSGGKCLSVLGTPDSTSAEEAAPMDLPPMRQKVVPFEERARAERERKDAERAADGNDGDAAPPLPPAAAPSGLVRAQRASYQQAVTERQQKLAPDRPRPSKAGEGAGEAAGKGDAAAGPPQKRAKKGLRRVLLDALVSRGTLVALTAAGAGGGVAMYMARSAAGQVLSSAGGGGGAASGGAQAAQAKKAASAASRKA